MVIIGCDVSLEHGGFCFLNENGQVDYYKYFSNNKKDVEKNASSVVFLGLKRELGEELERYNIRRACRYRELFSDHIIEVVQRLCPFYVVFEGYAYGAITNSLCQIAELTGALKTSIYRAGGIMRIHDPISVKFFATGKGNATKKEMVDQALKEKFLGEELVKQIPVKYVKRKRNKVMIDDCEGLLTDVVDAYFLARLLWTELQLREGKISLQDLSLHQIQVFNRTTKMYPVNILARPFIQQNN